MTASVHGAAARVVLGATIAVAGVSCSSGSPPFTEAAHTAAPQVIALGGPVLASPVLAPVVFQGDPLGASIVSFVSDLPASPWWSSSLSEYGVGAATVAAGQSAPAPGAMVLGDADLRQMLQATFAQAKQQGLSVPWDRQVTVFFTPPGVTVTAPLGPQHDTLTLCQQVGGYHSFVQLDATTLGVYAVVPRCAMFGTLSGLDEVTAVASHEIAEACTDPYAADVQGTAQAKPAYALPNDLSWFVAYGGGEIGDMCASLPGAFSRDASLGAYVQHIWSNAAAAAGHDPCGILSPYFDAAPVLDTISLQFLGVDQPTTGPGLAMSVGSSRTVEVDPFSDGPVGQFTIEAKDMEQVLGMPPSLALSFDDTFVNNGKKVHLTITVQKAGQLLGVQGLAGAVLVSHLNLQGSLWPLLVRTQ